MRRFSLASLPILLISLLAIMLTGCASDIRSDSLSKTLNQYASVLRWGDFASAQQFLDPDYREAHPLSPLDLARYTQVRVSSYDDGQGAVPSGENEVRQVVQINLINNNTQSERTVVDHQTWRYDPATHKWWLMTGLPVISQQ
jgi:hypothetical protein